MVLLLLVGTAVPSFAAEPEADNPVTEIKTQNLYTTMVRDMGGGNTSAFSDFRKILKNAYGVPVVAYHNNNPKFYEAGAVKTIQISDYLLLKADTHYNLDFGHSVSFATAYNVKVTARVFSNGKIRDIVIYDENFNNSDYKIHYSNFNFILKSSELGSNYKIKLYFENSIPSNQSYGSNGQNVEQYLTQVITLEDLDSNAKWYQRIINTIKAVPDKLKLFFSDLGNTIKQKFTELGDRIHIFFVDLKNDILEGLKKLFIPPDGYFDNYKQQWDTWAKEHLGFIYDIGDVTKSFIERFFDYFKIDTYTFTFPEASFTIRGEKFVIWQEKVVDMAYILNIPGIKFLYEAYKIIAFAIFCFCLQRYAFDTASEIIEGVKGMSS